MSHTLGFMAEKPSRKHHTVPGFLLRRFADEREQLTRVELPGENRHTTAVARATVHNGFHLVLTEDGQVVDAFEHDIVGLEGEASAALSRILDDDEFPPSQHDREAISILVALQYLRTPAVREQQRQLNDQLFKTQVALLGRSGIARTLREADGREPAEAEVDEQWAFWSDPEKYDVLPSPERHIGSIRQMLPELAERLLERSWTLTRWQRRGLIMSDTPVVLLPPPGPEAAPVGLVNADRILMAVDRRALLQLGTVGEDDAFVEGNTVLANAANQVFALNTRQAFFHHPDDARMMENLLLHPPITTEVHPGLDFEAIQRWGDELREKVIDVQDDRRDAANG